MAEIEKMTRMNRTLIDALSEEKAVRQRLEEKVSSHGVIHMFKKKDLLMLYTYIHTYIRT